MKGIDILIGFVLGIFLLIVVYALFQFSSNILDDKFEDIRNESIQEGFSEGYFQGLLYTQQTGNITFLDNNRLAQEPLINVCNNYYQQLNEGGN